ncbi:MAG: hypothetical protein ACFFCS_10520 [Candidatus Hodarchaeota archaeon]
MRTRKQSCFTFPRVIFTFLLNNEDLEQDEQLEGIALPVQEPASEMGDEALL